MLSTSKAQRSLLNTLAAPAGLHQVGSARLGSALQILSSVSCISLNTIAPAPCRAQLEGFFREKSTDFPSQPCSKAASFLGVKVQVRGAELLTNTASGDDVIAQLTCGGHLNSSPRILVPVLRDYVQVSDSRWAVSNGNSRPTVSFHCLLLFIFCLFLCHT